MSTKIVLEELINGCTENLPEFVHHKNIIYCCENIITGKIYIGETKQTLRKRWLEHKHLMNNHTANKKNNIILYNAIRKYGTLNFLIYILEENLEDNNYRKEREKYWILTYNSFIDNENSNGYNMTTGGYLNTKLSKCKIKKQKNTCIEKYGTLPILTEESRQKSLETNKKNHNGILAFQHDLYRKKARETQYKKYGMLALHLPENKEKAKKAQEKIKEKNGGVLPFNTPESIEKAQALAPLYRMIGCINRNIKILNENNLEINANNYVYKTNNEKRMWQQHIPNVLRKLDDLRKLDKWTYEMEKIFSNIIYDNTEKGLKKIKFKENV